MFADPGDALSRGREVGETGRLVHLVERRFLRPTKLLAVFPDSPAAASVPPTIPSAPSRTSTSWLILCSP